MQQIHHYGQNYGHHHHDLLQLEEVVVDTVGNRIFFPVGGEHDAIVNDIMCPIDIMMISEESWTNNVDDVDDDDYVP